MVLEQDATTRSAGKVLEQDERERSSWKGAGTRRKGEEL